MAQDHRLLNLIVNSAHFSGEYMRFRRSWHRPLTLCFAILIVITVACIEYMTSLQHQYISQIEQENAKEELSIIRAKLESLIISDIYLVNSLPVVVATNREFRQEQWEAIAENIIERSSHINAILLAPDDVVEYVYPNHHRRFIGSDYRDRPEAWSAVQEAKVVEEALISDIVHFSSGERGLVARVPIFTDPPFNQNYWGVASVVIGLSNLLRDAGVYQLSKHYRLSIVSLDSQQQAVSQIFGEGDEHANAFSSELVHFPHGTWRISSTIDNGFLSETDWYQLNGARLIGYSSLLMLCIAFAAVYFLYHQANQRSLHDELTSLPNRRYFMFTLKRQFSMAQRSESKECFALLNIDLDKFKQINDRYGHDAGDSVLKAVGLRVQQALRGSDVVARVGGDEFLVLLPRVREESNAKTIVANVARCLCDEPLDYDGHSIEFSASIGYAMYQPEMASVEDILREADDAMYQDKLRDTK